MEYVYKLSAVDIDDLVKSRDALEKVHNPFLGDLTYGNVHYYKTQDVLKEDKLSYLDAIWEDAIVFGKNSKCVGTLHRDGDSKTRFSWAVNWVWGGKCVLDYWDDEKISEIIHENDSFGGHRFVAKADGAPSRSYILTPGVYLVHTSIFHRPATTGVNMRYTLSLRTGQPRFNTWEEVVNYFSKYIE